MLHERLRERIRREVMDTLELDNSRVYEMSQHGQYLRREPASEARLLDGQQLAQERVNEFCRRRSNGSEVPGSRAAEASDTLAAQAQI